MNTKSKVLVAGNDTIVGHNLHRVIPGNGFEITTLNAVNDATIHEAPKTERTMIKTQCWIWNWEKSRMTAYILEKQYSYFS